MMDTRTGEIGDYTEMAKRIPQEFLQPIDVGHLSPKVRQTVEQTGRGKIGRNDPCPCGSGKRFKRCCMAK